MKVFVSKKYKEQNQVSSLQNPTCFANPEDHPVLSGLHKEQNLSAQQHHIQHMQQDINLQQKSQSLQKIVSKYEPQGFYPQLLASDSQRRINITKKSKVNQFPEEKQIKVQDKQKIQNKKADNESPRKIHHLGKSRNLKDEKDNEQPETRLSITKRRQTQKELVNKEEKTILSGMREQPTKAGITLLINSEEKKKRDSLY